MIVVLHSETVGGAKTITMPNSTQCIFEKKKAEFGYSPLYPFFQLGQLSVVVRKRRLMSHAIFLKWVGCISFWMWAFQSLCKSLNEWNGFLTPLAGSPGAPLWPSSPFNPKGPVCPWKNQDKWNVLLWLIITSKPLCQKRYIIFLLCYFPTYFLLMNS